MQYLKIILLLSLLTQNIIASDNFSFSLGTLKIGEKRLDLNLNDIKITSKTSNTKIATKIIKNEVSWVREAGNILVPKALISVLVKSDKAVTLDYENQIMALQGDKVKSSFVYIDLFSNTRLKIYEDGVEIDEIGFKFDSFARNKEGHLVDYSCSKLQIEITGLDRDYLSLGCTIERLGKIGHELNRVIITMIVNGKTIAGHDSKVFYSILMDDRPISLNLIDSHNKSKNAVVIKTKFPRRANRLHLAMGLGPYTFNIAKEDSKKNYDLASAAMLYGRLDFTESSSARLFEAIVYRDGLFSNTGAYFAYDLARLFDDKIRIVPLLGAQILTYKYDLSENTSNRIIYPQGFEASFYHAFGIKNFNFTYGMFLSTQTDETYKNIWLRTGKGIFWELNYIKWAHDKNKAEMLGLSIGFPIGKFF